MEGLQCFMSNLRNDHITYHYFHNFHFNCKMILCHMQSLGNSIHHVLFFQLLLLCSMSHVNLKNWLYRRVEMYG